MIQVAIFYEKSQKNAKRLGPTFGCDTIKLQQFAYLDSEAVLRTRT